MANTAITGLVAITDPQTADVMHIIDDPSGTPLNRKITLANLFLVATPLTPTTIVASGIIKTDDATDATSGTDGSLQTDGGLSVVKDIFAGNDLLLGSSGSVINWNSGDVTLTHAAGKLTLGGDGAVEFDFASHEMTNVDINSGTLDGVVLGATNTYASLLAPSNDSGAIGAAGTAFSDIFLASGSVVNFNNGDVTITHESNGLVFAGGDIAIGATISTFDKLRVEDPLVVFTFITTATGAPSDQLLGRLGAADGTGSDGDGFHIDYVVNDSGEAEQVAVRHTVSLPTVAAGGEHGAQKWQTVLSGNIANGPQFEMTAAGGVGAFNFTNGYVVLPITDTDGTVEGSLWYDASEDKLKFKTAAGVETITSS